MDASQKSLSMESFLTKMTGVDRVATIQANTCTWCGKTAAEFRNDISRREYSISGFCQSCQDDVFGLD